MEIKYIININNNKYGTILLKILFDFEDKYFQISTILEEKTLLTDCLYRQYLFLKNGMSRKLH